MKPLADQAQRMAMQRPTPPECHDDQSAPTITSPVETIEATHRVAPT